MKKLLASRLLGAVFSASLLLSACGGGGGGDDAPVLTPPSTRFGASSDFENVCTVEGQKRFIRSYLDEVYLWYNEIPEVNAALYSDVTDYFDALTNLPQDKFSTAFETGFGRSSLAQSLAPNNAQANHTPYVPVARVDTSPAGRRVAYIRFRDHETGAQDDLITAFQQVRNAGAQDLILDLRENSGGFLYIALTAASLVTGPAAEGKVFEQLTYNDKRSGLTARPESTYRFSSVVQNAEFQYPNGTALPQLNLPRVYVLTSGLTCSSSESIINGLRGIDVQVILVGTTTCGKPYGFHRKDTCNQSYSYFPIEFKGANAKGFGDYVDGFAPTCPATPSTDPTVTAGSAADPLYATAQYHIANGSCPPAPATAQASAAPGASLLQPSRPLWTGRLVDR